MNGDWSNGEHVEAGPSSSQLLLEIITREESHDLRLLVDEIKRQVGRHLSDFAVDWSEADELSVMDFVQAASRETFFVGPVRAGVLVCTCCLQELVTHKPAAFCYFIKVAADMVITPDNILQTVHSGAVPYADFTRQFEAHFHKLATLAPPLYKEVQHLLLAQLLKVRQSLIGSRCLDNAILSRPLTELSGEDADYDERIQQSEKLAIQWISVLIYNLEMKGSARADRSDPVVLEDEIRYWEKRRDVLNYLKQQITQRSYQDILSHLKKANSVIGDELESLQIVLKDEHGKAASTAKYLTHLKAAADKIKYSSLLDLCQVYQEICDRVIIVVKHARGYTDHERSASQLLFLIGNQVMDKWARHAHQSVDKLINGLPRQSIEVAESVRRSIHLCISTFDNVLRWQRIRGRFNISVDRAALLSNFQTMEIRVDHIIDISQTMEQFGHFVKDVQQPLPQFTSERDVDLGQTLRQSQELVIQLILDLVKNHRDMIFAVHRAEWNDVYTAFQKEVRLIEIRLVNALEEALTKCPTLWKTFDTLTSFKFLYQRPLFSSVINASADRMFKAVSQEAKAACRIDLAAWNSPITCTVASHSSRMATAAQRANGYVDRIAKVTPPNADVPSTLNECRCIPPQLIQALDWAGSASFQAKALHRCKQVHQQLADVCRQEFADWCDRLRQDAFYNLNVARQKFVVCRHFQRADWIQSNLDGIVLQMIQTAECWDRLILDLPQSFQYIWVERNDLRIVYGSVTAMCYYHNYFIDGLTSVQKEQFRDILGKIERAVEPGLSRITWTQLPHVKKLVSSIYTLLDELSHQMSPPETPKVDPLDTTSPIEDTSIRSKWLLRGRIRL